MSDADSCKEIARDINIITGLINSSSGDPNEASAVFAEVAKSLETVSQQTSGEKSDWSLRMAQSAADASVGILKHDSTGTQNALTQLMGDLGQEGSYCSGN